MEQSTVKAPEAKKKILIRVEPDGTFTTKFTVKEGEMPLTRREFNLILRKLQIDYGAYHRQLILQQSLKQKAQGVTDAVA